MEERMLDMNIDDALIEKPYGFEVGDDNPRHFDIFPTTLGKLHVMKRHIDNLGINAENMTLNPNLEALRLCKEKAQCVCRVIALSTLKKKRDIFDVRLVSEITDYLGRELTAEDMAVLLLFILTRDDTDGYKKHLGITDENERMQKVVKAKEKARKSKNDYTFGGKTVYGTLIDTACERYGWSYDYVMWGISYVNLSLMLADKIQNVYVSDDEKKNISASLIDDGEVYDMDNKDNAAVRRKINWK